MSVIASALVWGVILGAVVIAVLMLKTKFKALKPSFLIAVMVLAVAAVSLNGATEFMQLHFKKQAVEIAIPLKEVRQQFGNWKQLSKDEPLESDIEASLATKEYIFREYVETSKIPEFEWKQVEAKSGKERKDALANLQYKHPDAVVNLAVTYYTGLVDTVAHIPDRCYIADGYEPTEYTTENWNIGARSEEVRFINFEDQSGVDRKQPRSVAYFFRVNDEYTSDPLRVRRRLQNLFEKYGYYAKVELMMIPQDGKDRSAVAKTMTEFLSEAMPEIERCFPDWSKVNKPEVK